MTCASCGSPMSSQRENHAYAEGGFAHVTLLNVEVLRCKTCGEWEVVLPKVEELHRLLTTSAARGHAPEPIGLVFDSTWKAA